MSTLPTLGFGYAIALALAFLFILSTLLLSSYLCRHRRRQHHHNNPPHPRAFADGGGGVMIPSIIFMPEDGHPDRPDSPTGVVGLDAAVISSYPKFQFSKTGENPTSRDCSICLCEYREGEMLRMIPDCRHAFHLMCIDAWLRLNCSCPVCRCSPLPTPLSTPLAEVVPLAQFGDSRRWRPS